LATISQQTGNLTEALATLERALRHFPDGEFLLYLQADCLYELDRFREAKSALTRILTSSAARQYRGGVPGEIREKLAPRKLADVLRLEGDQGSAELLLTSAVNRFPDHTISWHTLGRVYLDWRQRTPFLAVVERLRSCPQGDVFALLLLATWHLIHN